MRPTILEVLPLVREHYAQLGDYHSVGGCLHVQLEDGNMEDHHFNDSSKKHVLDCGCSTGLKLFEMLKAMKRTARLKLYRKDY